MDAELCEQVFINLILNAYEAMPERGKVKVAVRAVNSDSHRGIEVQISDSGPGVPIELRERFSIPFSLQRKME